jgi:hypothetical protein
MLVRLLPLITGLLPIIAIHISLFVAINAASIPACIPYIEGCASISATGRYEPASFIFKPAMLSEWGILILYWLFNVAWLRALAREAGETENIGKWLAIIGTVGALALVLYTTFLGTQAPFYEFMRRIGIYFYFGCSVIAQIMLARHTLRLSGSLGIETVRKIGQVQMTIALVPFALGILNLVLKNTLADPDPIENIIEWIFALLMHIYFMLTYFAWRDTAFSGRFEISLARS